MITITVNWFSFILGFVACIITAVVIGVVGYFKDINQRNKMLEKTVELETREK